MTTDFEILLEIVVAGQRSRSHTIKKIINNSKFLHNVKDQEEKLKNEIIKLIGELGEYDLFNSFQSDFVLLYQGKINESVLAQNLTDNQTSPGGKKTKFLNDLSEIIGICKMIKDLNNYVELELNPPIQRKGPAKELSFNKLFKDPSHAIEVRKILESRGYTENGTWVGLTHDKSELLAAYHALTPVLIIHKKTPGAKAFYKEFKVPGLISDRMLRTELYNDNQTQFEELFSSLLTKPE